MIGKSLKDRWCLR